ncbi:hypothetical protein [Flavobacterium sp.]|uniref:hypothetical protein n=1 Tax=Flavobacterium sp. TaxID=239 RepID=UPI003F69B0A3
MKENKNIERLFQEKFKDFEAMPPADAWNNIAQRLNEKKKKRRVIPLWFMSTGIAASFLLLGLIGYDYFNTTTPTIENKKLNNKTNTFELNNNTKYVNGSKNTDENVKQFEDNSSSNLTNSNKKNITDNIENSGKFYSNKSIFTDNSNSSNNSNGSNLFKESNSINSELSEKELIFDKKNTTTNDLVFNINEIKSVNDSTLVATISKEVSELEELLKEKEVGLNADEKEKRNRWGVMSNVAPVYFNSLTNGSPLGNQFAENTKTFKPSVSYGVGVGYAITDKLNVRAGVNNLNFEYNTNDVFYSSTLNAVANDNTNLSRNANGQGIVFIDKSKVTSLSTDVENVVINTKGILNQQINFIEMPVELSYKLIDNKFSVDVIGGFSSLFLNQNSVSLISNGMTMEIGEASNLNNVHFSGNLGLGIKYNFLKSFEASFNPMIKHQINTYKNNSGNFNPYFIGLYSGLIYKF